jgi:hypothetical protein
MSSITDAGHLPRLILLVFQRRYSLAALGYFEYLKMNTGNIRSMFVGLLKACCVSAEIVFISGSVKVLAA